MWFCTADCTASFVEVQPSSQYWGWIYPFVLLHHCWVSTTDKFHCSIEAFSSQFSHTCSDVSTATSCPPLSVHSSSQAVIHTCHLLMQLREILGALGLMQSISPVMQTQQKCNKNEIATEAWVKIVISILLIARRDRMHTPRQPQRATCETH